MLLYEKNIVFRTRDSNALENVLAEKMGYGNSAFRVGIANAVCYFSGKVQYLSNS